MRVFTKEWFKAAGIRALKTFAQTFLSMLTVGAAFSEVEWGYVASCAGVAAVYSLLTSLAGLPELSTQNTVKTDATIYDKPPDEEK